jgi:uncharacterized protein
MSHRETSRRQFLQHATILGTALAFFRSDLFATTEATHLPPLDLFSYADVTLANDLCQRQLENTHSVLMGLNEDALMQPFRVMSGFPAPEDTLGGWYIYKPDYDYRKDSAGLCPGGTFGQWVSALSRHYAITGNAATREKVLRLNRLYAQSLGAGFFDKNRFPAYCYDKLVCGLIDSHQFAHDPDSFAILQQTTDTVLPYLPPHAVDREQVWRSGKESDISYTWDESYTLPENLFLAYQRGAGDRYKQLAIRFLDDPTYFDPLAAGVNVLPGKHAYSYVNALNSAMQAYFILGSEKHLRAARNAFEMLVTTQSFATGGWGPDELLREPNTGALAATLVDQHKSFETPCGAYAHFKLTRSLLRVTRDARYGDSMERVFYNTVLGAKPLQPDGTAYYYSDYSYDGHKRYSNHHWPCCSGTLPQVATDYHLNAYFRDAQGIYVNLYLPSTLRWDRGGNIIQLQQVTEYPFADVVRFELTAPRAADFSLFFRIPAWSKDASMSVNGKPVNAHIRPGQYFPLQSRWKSGDRIELRLPMTTRVEAIDLQHPNIVALLYGPLVLFPDGNRPKSIARQQLLSAKRDGAKAWQLQTAGGSIRFLPFTDLTDEPYSTYLTVT